MNSFNINEIKDKIDVYIGNRLKIMRTKAGISQKQLGQWIGSQATTICNYEQGDRPMPANLLPIVSTLCKESPNFFFREVWDLNKECQRLHKKMIELYSPEEEPGSIHRYFDIREFRKRGFGMPAASVPPDAYKMADIAVVVFMSEYGEMADSDKNKLLKRIENNNYDIIHSIFESD